PETMALQVISPVTYNLPPKLAHTKPFLITAEAMVLDRTDQFQAITNLEAIKRYQFNARYMSSRSLRLAIDWLFLCCGCAINLHFWALVDFCEYQFKKIDVIIENTGSW
ncbi:30347_t:CDS:2, partial [Gigaspora margarita]